MSENQNPSQLNLALPESLATIVRAALVAGLDEVSVGFESLGADFPAPIGWIVHLNRYEDQIKYQLKNQGLLPESDHHLMISQSPDDEAVSAYTPDGYLNEEQILAWIAEPRSGLGGHNISNTETEKGYFQKDAELMLKAISNGWDADRKINRGNAELLHHLLVDSNRAQPNDPILPSTTLSFSAPNWNYNTKGHPAHRDTGAKLSTSIHLVQYFEPDSSERTTLYSAVGADITQAQICLQMVNNTAPYAAPMACYDEENEEWVM